MLEGAYGILLQTMHDGVGYAGFQMRINDYSIKRDDSMRSHSVSNAMIPVLYGMTQECCGCSACYAVCPVHAIFMEENVEGFLYPVIDAAQCVSCYACIEICRFKERFNART